MQPYLLPYAGHYRLFNDIDLHVIYDYVQMIHPGFVHRNQLTRRDGKMDWLTIPLQKQSLDTKIMDIAFAQGASEKWAKNCRKFPIFDKRPSSTLMRTVALGMTFDTPLDFIVRTLEMTKEILGFTCPMIKVPRRKRISEKKGQDRVLAICKHFGATEYVNASGGSELYDPATFEKEGIELKILKPYEGKKTSILERIEKEHIGKIRDEVIENAQFIS